MLEVLKNVALYNSGAMALAQPQLISLLQTAADYAETDAELQRLSAILKVLEPFWSAGEK